MNLASWFRRDDPRFGLLTILLLGLVALSLAILPPVFHAGPRAETTATIIGFLPEGIIRAPWFHQVWRLALAVSTLIWLAGRGLPWSSWSTAVSFTMVWALRMENVSNGAHIYHAANMLVWIHAAWMQFAARDLQEARRDRRLWVKPTYPRWVFYCCVFYLGVFHTWAGVAKIAASGWDWGNGLSLQLWVHLWGWPQSPFGRLVLADRTIAALLQTGALLIETFSFLCWFGPRWRTAVGLGLLSFYTGVLGTFVDFGFHINFLLVAWFLLPVESWMRGSAARHAA